MIELRWLREYQSHLHFQPSHLISSRPLRSARGMLRSMHAWSACSCVCRHLARAARKCVRGRAICADRHADGGRIRDTHARPANDDAVPHLHGDARAVCRRGDRRRRRLARARRPVDAGSGREDDQGSVARPDRFRARRRERARRTADMAYDDRRLDADVVQAHGWKLCLLCVHLHPDAGRSITPRGRARTRAVDRCERHEADGFGDDRRQVRVHGARVDRTAGVPEPARLSRDRKGWADRR